MLFLDDPQGINGFAILKKRGVSFPRPLHKKPHVAKVSIPQRGVLAFQIEQFGPECGQFRFVVCDHVIHAAPLLS